MTHSDYLKVSKWAFGIIVAALVQAGSMIWWARGVIASIEIVKMQQDYIVNRVVNVEADIKEMKHSLGGEHGRVALHTNP